MSIYVQPPRPVFFDSAGSPLENGYIWIGAANLPPQTNPISVFWDSALTQPAAQPIRTVNGYPSNAGTPSAIYTAAAGSMLVQNKHGSLVYSTPEFDVGVIGDGDIVTSMLADNAVTTAKLADGAAALAKLDRTGLAGQVLTGQGAGNAPVWSAPQSVAQLQPISASVSASALTISASALSLDFRSTTLGSGAVTRVSGTPANLTISSGSTLGTVNNVQSDIAVLAINNAGTIELAAVNMAGTVINLSEQGVISTTAEGGAGAADSATVVYSTTARTNVAYRLLGIVRSTQTTAGTWATAPSLIQGSGGQAGVAMAMNAVGDAPMFSCRAWVNFNGTGTVAINASGNLSSITDNGVGDYTVNIRTAMQDTNYACTIGYGNDSGASGAGAWSHRVGLSRTAGGIRITSARPDNGALTDASDVNVSIFR